MRHNFYKSDTKILFFYFIATSILCTAASLALSLTIKSDTWWAMNITTAFSSVLTFALPAIIFWKWIAKGNIGKGLHINTPPRWRSMVYSVVLVFVMMPLLTYLITFTRDFLEYTIREDIFSALKNATAKSEELINLLTNNKNWAVYPISVITLAVVPAVAEEFFFRGTLQRLILRQWHKKALSVILTSVVFTLMHMDYFNWVGIFLCSVVLGYLYLYTSSLWTSIAFHFVSNWWNITMMFLVAHFPPEDMTVASHISPWMALLSAFFVWFIFKTMRSVNFLERKLKK